MSRRSQDSAMRSLGLKPSSAKHLPSFYPKPITHEFSPVPFILMFPWDESELPSNPAAISSGIAKRLA